MFKSDQWMYSSGGGGFYDHEIDGSLRLEHNDTSYLTRTQSAGNRRTFTFSCWVKLAREPSDSRRSTLFSAGRTDTTSGNDPHLTIWSDDYIRWEGDGGNFKKEWSMKFRDYSAWYHIVLRIDSTQSNSNNRVRLYVNGELQTDTRNNSVISQNSQYAVNQSGELACIGAQNDGGSPVRGSDFYMAEVNFVDGQSLDASSFGETKSGVWIPKAYSGSYGTNGFYLKFAGNTNDSSGNGNNWTANNVSSHDYVPDSPTNNFATLNVLGGSNLLDNSTFSQGNLLHGTTDAYDTALATMGVKTGKWYAEVRMGSSGSQMVGVRQTNALYDNSTFIGGAGGQTSFYRVGRIYTNGSYTSATAASSGDVIQIALDADNGYVWYGRNNNWYGTVDTSSGRVALNKASHGDEFFIGSGYRDNRTWNFGQDSTFAGATTAGGNSDGNGYGDFKYAPPSGYLALCTANLPVAEGVDPAEDNSPQDHFSTLIYTGNGSSTRNLTGVGFTPDLGWFKNRSDGSRYPMIADTVRGANKQLFSNEPLAEESDGNQVKGFLSDGYTLGNNHNVNENNNSHVVWNWKANGSGVSNTDGSITSTVSANTDAGFSIVSYTGTGSNATVGHGLNSAPEMIIVKVRNRTDSWPVYHIGNTSQPQTDFLWLDSSNATADLSSYWQDTKPNSSVFYLGNNGRVNRVGGYNFIAYCFHSVEGFSKFGSYEGNLSNDGPFVYTGFRPALVVVKDVDSAKDWRVHDNKRGPYNAIQTSLEWNTADAEATGTDRIDFVSNGFKIRNNSNGWNNTETYIYMAFAENPFKYANAR
jgi:O-glycosyl hydrolase